MSLIVMPQRHNWVFLFSPGWNLKLKTYKHNLQHASTTYYMCYHKPFGDRQGVIRHTRIHTHPCTSSFVKTLTGVMYSLTLTLI